MARIKTVRFTFLPSETLYNRIKNYAAREQKNINEATRDLVKIGLMCAEGDVTITTKDGKEAVILS